MNLMKAKILIFLNLISHLVTNQENLERFQTWRDPKPQINCMTIRRADSQTLNDIIKEINL